MHDEMLTRRSPLRFKKFLGIQEKTNDRLGSAKSRLIVACSWNLQARELLDLFS
jgi:hypothetical protein